MKFELTEARHFYDAQEDKNIVAELRMLGFTFHNYMNLLACDDNEVIVEIDSIEEMRNLSEEFTSSLIINFYVAPADDVIGKICIYNDYVE